MVKVSINNSKMLLCTEAEIMSILYTIGIFSRTLAVVAKGIILPTKITSFHMNIYGLLNEKGKHIREGEEGEKLFSQERGLWGQEYLWFNR